MASLQSPSPRRQIVTAALATPPPQLPPPPSVELSAGQSRALPLQQMPPQPPQLPLWSFGGPSFGSPRRAQVQLSPQAPPVSGSFGSPRRAQVQHSPQASMPEACTQPAISELQKNLSSSFFELQQVVRPSSTVRSGTVSRTVTPRAISPLSHATPHPATSGAPTAAPSTPIQHPACWAVRTNTPQPAAVKALDSRTQELLELHVQSLKASLQVLIEERVVDLTKRLEHFEERFERSLVIEHEEREEGILNLQRELRQQKDRSFMDAGRKDLSDSMCKRQDPSFSELTPRISKDVLQTSLAEFSQAVEMNLDAKFEALCRRTDSALADVAEQKSELATTIEKALAELCGGLALRQQEELQSVRRQVQDEHQRLADLLDRQQLQPLPGDAWARPAGSVSSSAGTGAGIAVSDLARRQEEQSLILHSLQQASEELRLALEKAPLQAADLEASIAHLRADVICQQEKQNITQQDVQNVGRLQQQMKRQIVELGAEMRLSAERGNLACEKVQAKLEACQIHPDQLQQVSGRIAGLENLARESHNGADSEERILQLEHGVEHLREAMRTTVAEAQRLAGQVWGELALRAAEQRAPCRMQATDSLQGLSAQGVQRGRTPTPRARPRSAPRNASARTANAM